MSHGTGEFFLLDSKEVPFPFNLLPNLKFSSFDEESLQAQIPANPIQNILEDRLGLLRLKIEESQLFVCFVIFGIIASVMSLVVIQYIQARYPNRPLTRILEGFLYFAYFHIGSYSIALYGRICAKRKAIYTFILTTMIGSLWSMIIFLKKSQDIATLIRDVLPVF